MHGDKYYIYYTNYVDPGLSGPDQVWDLTNMNDIHLDSLIFISKENGNNLIPQYNIAMISGIEDTTFFNQTENFLQLIGNVAGWSYSGFFVNPNDLLRYPFRFNTSYANQFIYWGSVSIGGDYTRKGIATVIYDGYGTLKLPNGIFNNVVRIHRAEEDTVTGYFTYKSTTDIFEWYLPGNHYPVASVQTFNDGFDTYSSGFYVFNIDTSFKETVQDSFSTELYPNPTTEFLNLNFPDKDIRGHTEINILDIFGRTVIYKNVDITDWNFEVKIDVTNFSQGTYFLKINNSGNIRLEKFVKS